jgi:subtilisin family serine protease
MTSGTSFSAAYISGLAALMIERNPQLTPNELRVILMKTARDLGAPGRDDLFGAGVADAYGAVSAVQGGAAVPVAAAPMPEAPANEPAPATRALEVAAPAMASDKPSHDQIGAAEIQK